jgi:hypothetical protein
MKIKKERGITLFVVLMALLLVTAIGVGMILLSNSETIINANYRDEQVALLAAKAGLEEARDRMAPSNPNTVTPPTILPGATGGPYLSYITASGVSPWSASGPNEDKEYLSEMGLSSPPSGSTWYSSASTNSAYSGPSSNPVPYKWVRINLKLDRSAYTNGTPYYVDGNSANANKQVCYDPVNYHELVPASGGCGSNNVYVITSYAVTASGSHRFLQEDTTLASLNFPFSAGLTIAGPSPQTNFSAANSNNYQISGLDSSSGPGCPAPHNVAAIGVDNPTDASAIAPNKLPKPSNYPGLYASPDVRGVTLPLREQTPAQLEATVAQIESVADYVVQGPASSLPSYGTAANPVTIVVDSANNGASANLSLSGNITGYGLLVVRGTYTASGNVGWNGVVLVLGQGNVQGNGGGNNSYNGAVFVANTRDSGGNLLGTLGMGTYNWSGGGGNGISYNSCLVVSALALHTYNVLSFHEIMQ